MNTPLGNLEATAELTVGLMFSLYRNIHIANDSTHAGKWEKSKFMGTELKGKTLGIIGFGNIAANYADDIFMQKWFKYSTHLQVLRDHPDFYLKAIVDKNRIAMIKSGLKIFLMWTIYDL